MKVGREMGKITVVKKKARKKLEKKAHEKYVHKMTLCNHWNCTYRLLWFLYVGRSTVSFGLP